MNAVGGHHPQLHSSQEAVTSDGVDACALWAVLLHHACDDQGCSWSGLRGMTKRLVLFTSLSRHRRARDKLPAPSLVECRVDASPTYLTRFPSGPFRYTSSITLFDPSNPSDSTFYRCVRTYACVVGGRALSSRRRFPCSHDETRRGQARRGLTMVRTRLESSPWVVLPNRTLCPRVRVSATRRVEIPHCKRTYREQHCRMIICWQLLPALSTSPETPSLFFFWFCLRWKAGSFGLDQIQWAGLNPRPKHLPYTTEHAYNRLSLVACGSPLGSRPQVEMMMMMMMVWFARHVIESQLPE